MCSRNAVLDLADCICSSGLGLLSSLAKALAMSHHSSSLIISMMKSNVRKAKPHLAYTSGSQSVVEGSQGWDPREKHGETPLTGLLTGACLDGFLI